VNRAWLVSIPVALLGAGFAVFWARALVRSGKGPVDGATPPPDPRLAAGRPSARELLIGVVTDFLDTLGIGSFATTTALFRLWKVVPDRVIPGTLNAGHTLPTTIQALIYIAIIDVDAVTLAVMIGAAMAGAMLGAGAVARWPEGKVRVGMAIALFGAALLLLARLFHLLPPGADARGLSGVWLGAAALGNFALGALMTMGIGLYAPCMILVSMLGMNPQAAFPIMMGSCACLMPLAAVRFIGMGSYAPRAALGLTIGGAPAVLIAAYVVKELQLDLVRGLVVVVVLYTALTLLRDRRRS
jgi:uncharacterized membrane protein YfcA